MANLRIIQPARICLVIVIGMLSCRSTKGRRSETYRENVISEVATFARTRQRQLNVNGSQQMWSFYSDSAFTFHPDTGLRALSGYLLFTHTALQAEQSQHTIDVEVKTSNAEALSYDVKQSSRQGISPRILGAIFFASLLLAFLLVRRLLWPFRLL